MTKASSQPSRTTALPYLTSQPRHYADCCLSLSSTLVNILSQLLLANPSPGVTLSIGSGTGLLEALLNQNLENVSSSTARVEGVEVRSLSEGLNCYLPEELTHEVDGTWAICRRVEAASGLMFVYPRTVALVDRYLKLCAEDGSTVNMVFWLGPKVDWVDYEKSFHVTGFDPVEVMEDCGLVEYEVLIVLRRSSKS